jgi:hypothetical protein
MRWPAFPFVVLLCHAVLAGPGVAAQISPSSSLSTTKEAYVTLLYGEQFLLGVRVLGQSLRDSGTKRCVQLLAIAIEVFVLGPVRHTLQCRDMVVITIGDISEYSKTTLLNDGWRVREVETVQNPSMRDDGHYPARFWAVYTKINVFNMTEYRKGAHRIVVTVFVACVHVLRVST